MASNVEITSKEMIKPSSPTPTHLRNQKLSILDQITPSLYVSLIFFYKRYHPKLQESLKKSLSDVLTEFYPFAGRFCNEKFIVDCNDSGALFVECKADGNLSEVIKDPIMDELQKYLPLESSNREGNPILLAIQINLFDCGGVAVAVQMHHKVCDGHSMASFLNAWAAASRGSEETFSPTFDMATIFPPNEMFNTFGSVFTPPPPMLQKIVTRRLIFDKKDLENLKNRESKAIKDPTRVEAVSSFLLKRFREASRARGSEKQLAALHAVNLRPRMDPPLSGRAFGNAVFVTVGLLPVDGDDVGGDLVEVFRTAIRKIDEDFVERIQNGGDECLDSLMNINVVCMEKDAWLVTSWSRFPFYDVDYGWGRPAWVIPVIASSNRNVVIMMSTSSEDGIEAWVNLLEEDAAFIDFSL